MSAADWLPPCGSNRDLSWQKGESEGKEDEKSKDPLRDRIFHIENLPNVNQPDKMTLALSPQITGKLSYLVQKSYSQPSALGGGQPTAGGITT